MTHPLFDEIGLTYTKALRSLTTLDNLEDGTAAFETYYITHVPEEWITLNTTFLFVTFTLETVKDAPNTLVAYNSLNQNTHMWDPKAKLWVLKNETSL